VYRALAGATDLHRALCGGGEFLGAAGRLLGDGFDFVDGGAGLRGGGRLFGGAGGLLVGAVEPGTPAGIRSRLVAAAVVMLATSRITARSSHSQSRPWIPPTP